MIAGLSLGQHFYIIGIVVLFIGMILWFIGCERILYSGCLAYRDIPVVNSIALPIMLVGAVIMVAGYIVPRLRKSTTEQGSSDLESR